MGFTGTEEWKVDLDFKVWNAFSIESGDFQSILSALFCSSQVNVQKVGWSFHQVDVDIFVKIKINLFSFNVFDWTLNRNGNEFREGFDGNLQNVIFFVS